MFATAIHVSCVCIFDSNQKREKIWHELLYRSFAHDSKSPITLFH